eukprot:TRINITY_DN49322_c0_g1_i1.p1 TRINITY_DN49322_c0_g1~~TRINITY_DN49322_c0_g1_i1.p1  ORF type:complete len:695 (-),score=133.82 TRINITY_DN49322_c0_g1_i1:43-2127(-)
MASLSSLWGQPAFCAGVSRQYLTITGGDVNAFLFLFADNMSSLLAILAEMVFIPNIVFNFKPGFVPIGTGAYASNTVDDYLAEYNKMVWGKVCPAIGFALVFGNLWYSWMACKLAKAEDRTDVTALPYGINTPAGFLTVFMVMLPILFDNNPSNQEISPEDFAIRSFQGACCANFVGGIFEVLGIVCGQFFRRNIPRAALFGPVCGVGFVWLGFNPLIDVMREPIVGMLPLFLVFIAFFANGGKGWYPQKVPVAFIIMALGTALWWLGLARHDTEKRELNDPSKMSETLNMVVEKYAFQNSMTPFLVLQGFQYMKSNAVAVQIPIALASFIETIENVEMAAICGDSYNMNEAMLADGVGTMVGAVFGSPLPTTVYIGHKRHKVAGAKMAYSLMNGAIYFILFISGLMPVIFYIIDPTTVGCVLIAVGLMIVQLALESSSSRHYPCLMIGIMFLVADMLYFDHFDATVRVATRSIGRMKGVMNMAPGGGIMCSLIIPAILCDLVDARFFRSSIFCLIAAALSFCGLMHGANYHQPDGMMIPAMGADESDYYTTDLGEFMLSLPETARYESWQTDFLKSIGVGFISQEQWTYKVDDLGFDDPYRCPPWMQVANSTNTYGLPCPEPVKQKHAYNEGWRFAVIYLVGAAFIALHGIWAQKVGIEPIMDNGAVPDAAPDAVPDAVPAEKKEEDAGAVTI